jgi:hypothetical protein
VQALSGFSVAAQLFSPRHAVGRVTATSTTVVFGGMALGSWLWGHVAEGIGLQAAIAASGAAMVLVAAIGFLLPMPSPETRSEQV